MRNDLERIKDMQESLDNIQRYTVRGANIFFENQSLDLVFSVF